MPSNKRQYSTEKEPSPKRARESNRHVTENKRHIVIIGAGVSGILLAHHFHKYLQHAYTFKIIEKNSDLGGTWFENTYPGCACDVPSDIYQYSFAPSKNWSSLFASSKEIQQYLSHVVDHFSLRDFIEFNTLVEKCAWNDHQKKWIIDTRQNEIPMNGRKADVLINASGILNQFQYPDIIGLETFNGKLMHTANWDDSIDLTGKNVSVIGAGASAIQVVPKIKSLVKSLSVFIRTPSWITDIPEMFRHSRPAQGLSEEEYLKHCKGFESYYNQLFPVFHRASTIQQRKRRETAEWMTQKITNSLLREKLIPSYELGCRRISPGEPFLHALQEPNVHCIFDEIVSCSAPGLQTHASTIAADIIIAATGFNTSFRPRFSLIGQGGTDLRDLWMEEPSSYMGLGCAGFPNYLSMLGPNCPVANGSLIGSLEAMGHFIVRLLKRMHSFDATTFSPSQGAQDDFNKQVETFMKDAVWTGSCTSWYKRGTKGKITAVWPGSSLHYREVLNQDRWEDWDWTYSSGRFNIWGKGESMIEKAGGDHSYYLRHGPFLPNKFGDMGSEIEELNQACKNTSKKDLSFEGKVVAGAEL